jgi:peptidoglycan/LPS O-acetylase OafA/YrhL
MGIFDSVLLTEVLLPFLLVFVLVFAILQKSKILGDGKAQIDALVSLAIALMLIAFETPRDIVVNLMPWLAVGLSVILVFMILYGLVAGDLSNAPDWMKWVFGILAGLFTIGVVLYVTGFYTVIQDWFSGTNSIMSDVIIIVVIGVALAVAFRSGGSSGKSE